MPEPPSSIDNGQGARVLSPEEQRIFNHWRKVLTSPILFSSNESPRSDGKSYAPKDLPPPPVPPTTIPAPGREHITPRPVRKDDLVSSARVRQEEREHKYCVSVINRLFETSPLIIFMNDQLKKVGCPVPIACAPCGSRVRGGFDPRGGIVICQDNNWQKRTLQATLVHEMIHAFDHCRFHFDTNNLKQAACSEVGPLGRLGR